MSKKTIDINPDLFNIGGKTRKKRDKKEKLTKEALQLQILHALNITPKGLTLLIQQIGENHSEEIKLVLQGLILEEKITFNDGLYFLK